MTCKYFSGIFPHGHSIRCYPTPIKFKSREECEKYAKRYCLGQYPECREFKWKERER